MPINGRGEEGKLSTINGKMNTDGDQMNIAQLEYFISAMDFGSYSSASKSLYVNPSTVSIAISQLERELGLDLFIRTETGVKPTEFGEFFYFYAQEALVKITQLKSRALDYRDNNTSSKEIAIAVDSCPTYGSLMSKEVIKGCFRLEHGMTVKIHEYPSPQCLQALEAKHVDGAFVAGKPKQQYIKSIKLCSADIVTMVSKEGDFANLRHITPKDIAEATIATPVDFGSLYNAVVAFLDDIAVSPTFVDIEMSGSGIIEFIKCKNAIVFAILSTELKTRYPEMLFIPLAKQHAFELPVFFTYLKEANLIKLEPIIEFFTKEVFVHRKEECKKAMADFSIESAPQPQHN